MSTTICTHAGKFHADEVLATAILFGVFSDVRLIRSRDPSDWASADIVYDVGGSYDGEKFFDHHQKGGAGKRANGIAYAASGLIWKRFGRDYCQKVADVHDVDVEAVFRQIDASLISGVDAEDCGAVAGGYVHKNDTSTQLQIIYLPALIGLLNPISLVEEESIDVASRFATAVDLARMALERSTLAAVSQCKSAAIVQSADRGERVLQLPTYCDWQEVVIEQMPHVLFVVYPHPDGNWRLQTVPKRKDQFGAREDLPASWAGLTAEALQAESGVADAIFCHNGRFMAVAKTEEGAITLASLALLALD